ncbi:helix-turn-helix domain-containing protein [Aureimonas psammosilenae]|uniref:helix-turn-helix transcriptional regulator n=1 Tax=Aureimonas psammosilenae TaxID=2495496 RepID=UPI001F1A3FB8|nr:helix-turn-helix transcriptional regulator [Aureimonas psammosilenae]
MTTAQQIRAGRALVNMGQKDLADAADIAVATLRRMESDDVGPERSSFAAVEKVREVLVRAGVIFLDDGSNVEGGAGVRLRKGE